jgi:hypothetical protein
MNTTAINQPGKVVGWAKSKAIWFIGLLLRLGLVAVVTGFVAVEAMGHWGGPDLGWLLGLGLPLATGLVAVTWAVHHRLPFFRSRTAFQRWLIAGAGSLLLLVVAAPALHKAATLAMYLNPASLAQFASPANAANEIRFYSMSEYHTVSVKPTGERERLLATLREDGYRLSTFQWTKDGQMVVYTMSLGDTPKREKPPEATASVIAYDFSTDQSLVPLWIKNYDGHDRPLSDWRQAEAEVLKLVAAHGGFNQHLIDDNELLRHLRQLWPWETPEF